MPRVKVGKMARNTRKVEFYVSLLVMLGALSMAPVARAHLLSGFGLDYKQDPPCAGVQTPANESAWRTLVDYERTFDPMDRHDLEDLPRLKAELKPMLEAAAAKGDSWSQFILGAGYLHYNMHEPVEEFIAANADADAYLEKALKAGNCAASEVLSERRQQYGGMLISRALAEQASGNQAEADQDYTRGYSLLKDADELQKKAQELGFGQDSREINLQSAVVVHNNQIRIDSGLHLLASNAQYVIDREAKQKRDAQDLIDKAAEDKEYQRDLKLFIASTSLRKEIGDDVCSYNPSGGSAPSGQVERIAGDKVQIRYQSGGRAPTSITVTNQWGTLETVQTSAGAPPTDHLQWVAANSLGSCDKVTQAMNLHANKEAMKALAPFNQAVSDSLKSIFDPLKK